MKIIIPMSGQGKRFNNAGYKTIKPLIMIGQKPMIEHVVNLFPGENDFVFICNENHLKKTGLKKTLKKIAPKSKIIGIKKHKFGPVFAVLQAISHIKDEEEVIVNYCDFSTHWNYKDFKNKVQKSKCDGAITSYTGFHPHLLWPNKYAGMKVNNKNQVIKIKEKYSFTKNLMNSFHSAGTYYFKKGKYVKKYFKELIEKKMRVNNEYYVSSVYELMLKDKKKILNYELEFFLQFGTPQDLEEYKYWHNYFQNENKNQKQKSFERKTTVLVPIAGLGKRFLNEGWKTPKPLIDVSGTPMFMQSIMSLPKANEYVFVCLKKHVQENKIDKKILEYLPHAKIVVSKAGTQGQAETCILAEKIIDPNSELVITACDSKMLLEKKYYDKALQEKPEAIIWTFRNNPAIKRKPEAYAYVKEKNGIAKQVYCKKTISKNPVKDHAVTGTFYFKTAKTFFASAKKVVQKNLRINNEFYVDIVPNELINAKKKVLIFEVKDYVIFGTPADLKTYNYWEKYFSKSDFK